jgi:hypothetical protein
MISTHITSSDGAYSKRPPKAPFERDNSEKRGKMGNCKQNQSVDRKGLTLKNASSPATIRVIQDFVIQSACKH